MRLLSPQEVVDEKRKDTDVAVAKGARLAALVDKERKLLNDLRSEKEKDRQKIQGEFDIFLTEITERKSILEGEVMGLEERKKEALKPLDQIKKDLENREAGLDIRDIDVATREENAKQREQDLVGQVEKAEKKEEFLSEWEQTLASTDSKYQAKGQDLKRQEEKLSSESQAFLELMALKEEEFTKKQDKFEEVERTLQMKFGELENQKEEIRKDREHLYSQQADLRLVFEEARRRNLL